MIVLVLTAVPPGLRGHLTRWLVEIAPGVFVGKVSKRIREQLWMIVMEMLGSGKALMVFTARNEQGLDFRSIGHDWIPTEYEGLTLLLRPAPMVQTPGRSQAPVSKAERWRRSRQFPR